MLNIAGETASQPVLLECAQEMLRHGASPNAVGPGGESVLSMAVQHVAGKNICKQRD